MSAPIYELVRAPVYDPSGPGIAIFERLVSDRLAAGWEVVGSMQIHAGEFLQAMVKIDRPYDAKLPAVEVKKRR